MARPLAAVIAATAFVCIIAMYGAAAQDCSSIPGCTACQEVTGRARGGRGRSLLRREDRPGRDRGDDAVNGTRPPCNETDDGPGRHGNGGGNDGGRGGRHNETGSHGGRGRRNETRLVCTTCATAGYKIDDKKGVCGCADGFGVPAPVPGTRRPDTPQACTPCADGYVSGSQAKGKGRGRSRGRSGSVIWCVACRANATSNAEHTACV